MSPVNDHASSAPTAEEEEEDDYLSMTIVDPVKTEKETYTQRRIRKQREVGSLNLLHETSIN